MGFIWRQAPLLNNAARSTGCIHLHKPDQRGNRKHGPTQLSAQHRPPQKGPLTPLKIGSQDCSFIPTTTSMRKQE